MMPHFAAWKLPQESPRLPPGFSQNTENEHRNECKGLLTSAGWVRGWNRSRSPVSSFSHLTVFPPGRHSRSGRLPEARAPSPSRTRVGNDGVIQIQQISHISFSPLCPYFSVWGGKASLCRSWSKAFEVLQSGFDAHSSPVLRDLCPLTRCSLICTGARPLTPPVVTSPKTSEAGRIHHCREVESEHFRIICV